MNYLNIQFKRYCQIQEMLNVKLNCNRVSMNLFEQLSCKEKYNDRHPQYQVSAPLLWVTKLQIS